MPIYTYICENCGREEQELRPVAERDRPFVSTGFCEVTGHECECTRKFEMTNALYEVVSNGHQRGFAKDALEQARLEQAALDMEDFDRDEAESEAEKIMQLKNPDRSKFAADGSKKRS